jgi:hypothetical protein
VGSPISARSANDDSRREAVSREAVASETVAEQTSGCHQATGSCRAKGEWRRGRSGDAEGFTAVDCRCRIIVDGAL